MTPPIPSTVFGWRPTAPTVLGRLCKWPFFQRWGKATWGYPPKYSHTRTLRSNYSYHHKSISNSFTIPFDHPILSPSDTAKALFNHFTFRTFFPGEYFGLQHTKHVVGTASPFPSHWQLWVGNCETSPVARFNICTIWHTVSWFPSIFFAQILLARSGSRSEHVVKYSSTLPSRDSDIHGFQYGLSWLPIESFGEGFVLK